MGEHVFVYVVGVGGANYSLVTRICPLLFRHTLHLSHCFLSHFSFQVRSPEHD